MNVSADDARGMLRAHGHALDELEPLSGGMWSSAFAFAEGGREYVVRFHDRRDDLEKDRFAERWASPRLRMGRLTEIGDLPSGAYGISERVNGTHIDRLDAEGMRGALPPLFDALDSLRAVEPTGTSGWGLWHGDGNAPHVSWPDALMRSAGKDRRRIVARSAVGAQGFDAGVSAMRELLAAGPDRRHVVHNDLLYNNVIRDERGVVLLDWGASIYGDFVYDLALLCFWWPYYREWATIDIDGLVRERFGDAPRFAERLRLCELDIGISHIPFQLEHRDLENAQWTSRRTAERARAPL